MTKRNEGTTVVWTVVVFFVLQKLISTPLRVNINTNRFVIVVVIIFFFMMFVFGRAETNTNLCRLGIKFFTLKHTLGLRRGAGI